MSKQIGVFVSHHHSSEEDTFTRRLVADLQTAGADVWVDYDSITYDSFVKNINEGLAGREWLVLVMTPAALRSSWVNDEVNAALNQVRKGKMRGVIPIVAEPCDDDDIPILWDPLQRYDATKDYQAALSRLLRALGITHPSDIPTQLLQATAPPAPKPADPLPIIPVIPPSVPLPSPSTTPKETAADARPTRTVDASGKGQHRTIKEAVEVAQSGERILIAPGIYRESISINKQLELAGQNRHEVIIEDQSGAFGQAACILVTAKGVVMTNLSVRQLYHGMFSAYGSAVWIKEGGDLRMEDCDVTSQGAANGVEMNAGDLTVRRTTIHNCGGNGFILKDSASIALIEDCTIMGCNKSAILVQQGSATVRNSRLTSNKAWGVKIDSGGRGTFENNQLSGNSNGNWNIAATNPEAVKSFGNQE